MKKTEKAAIARIITDLIKADGIIDLREMNTLDDLQNKYDITDNDWKSGGSIHLAESLDVLKELDAETRQELLNDFCHVAMSDDFCAKEEALLLLCLQLILKPHNDFKAQILSVNSTELNFDNSQMLYVEGEYDESINTQMRQNYREICNEVRLSGFELVYLPKVSEHYQSIPQHTLLRIASLLYPQVGNKRLDYVVQQMLTLNTATFCNEHLAGKLQMKKLQGVSPAFMIKIGKADIDDNAMDNFLIVYIHTSPVATMRFIMDSFARFYHNLNINYIREKRNASSLPATTNRFSTFSCCAVALKVRWWWMPHAKLSVFPKLTYNCRKFTGAKRPSMRCFCWNRLMGESISTNRNRPNTLNATNGT